MRSFRGNGSDVLAMTVSPAGIGPALTEINTALPRVKRSGISN
jgi:hypothetical protein